MGRNEKCAQWRIFTSFMAEWTGLEPATPGVTGRYSNQLNYHSAVVLNFGLSLNNPRLQQPVPFNLGLHLDELASPRGFEPLLQP